MSVRIPQDGGIQFEELRLRRVLDTFDGSESEDWTETARALLGTTKALLLLGPHASCDLALFAGDTLPTTTLVVPDASVDERFAGRPLKFRFLASTPIFAGETKLGTLFCADPASREPSEGQVKALESLARQISTSIVGRYELDRQTEIAAKLAEDLEAAEQGASMARQAAHRFEQLFNSIPVACFSFDCDGTIREWNAAAEKLWGIAFVDSLCTLAVGPETEELVRSQLERVFAGATVSGRDRRERMADGTHRWIVSSTAPLRDLSGRIYGAMCANIDRTDRREQALKFDAHLKQLQEYASQIEEGDPIEED